MPRRYPEGIPREAVRKQGRKKRKVTIVKYPGMREQVTISDSDRLALARGMSLSQAEIDELRRNQGIVLAKDAYGEYKTYTKGKEEELRGFAMTLLPGGSVTGALQSLAKKKKSTPKKAPTPKRSPKTRIEVVKKAEPIIIQPKPTYKPPKKARKPFSTAEYYSRL